MAKLEKCEDSTIDALVRTFWDVQQLGAAMAAALITCTRGEVATLVRRILSVSPGDALKTWFAVTHWFKPRPVMEQVAAMARLISPKRTKNVNELQVAAMQWELTLVEHESKFSEVVADSAKTAATRATLPKDALERFLDGQFQYEELRNRMSAYVGETGWTRREQWSPTHGHLDRSTNPRERTKMSMQFNSVVRTIDPIRNTCKSPTTSEHPSIIGLPTRHHQRHANRLQETRKIAVMRRNRVRGRGKGYPARLSPSADDCQDVDEVETEPSSDADSDLFGLGR